MFRCFYAEAVVIIPLIPSVLVCRYKMCLSQVCIIFHQNAISSPVEIKCIYPSSVIIFHQNAISSPVDVKCVYPRSVIIFHQNAISSSVDIKCVYPRSVIIFHQNAVSSSVDIKCFYPKSVIRHHHHFALLPYMLVSASFEYVAGISWKIGRQDNVGRKKQN